MIDRDTNLDRVEAHDSCNETDAQDSSPPPERNLFILVAKDQLVVRVEIRVVDFARKALFRCLRLTPEHVDLGIKQFVQVSGMHPAPSALQIVPVPKQHVDNCGSESGIRSNEVCDVSACQVRDPFDREFGFVDCEIRVQDECLVVDSVIRGGRSCVEQRLGEERKFLGLPKISVVYPC
jgi:hypothetical protein